MQGMTSSTGIAPNGYQSFRSLSFSRACGDDQVNGGPVASRTHLLFRMSCESLPIAAKYPLGPLFAMFDYVVPYL